MSDATRVLFDAPGPRGRRRIRIATVVVLVVIAGLLAGAVLAFAAHGQLASQKWLPFRVPQIWTVLLLPGIGNTAHAYDDFAPGLTDRFHVYAMTRRGFDA